MSRTAAPPSAAPFAYAPTIPDVLERAIGPARVISVDVFADSARVLVEDSKIPGRLDFYDVSDANGTWSKPYLPEMPVAANVDSSGYGDSIPKAWVVAEAAAVTEYADKDRAT